MVEAETEAPRVRRPVYLVAAAALGVVLALALAFAVRVVPTTGAGRAFIERQVLGVKVGRLGHLRLSGLSGDPWGHFGVARLEIYDRDGVWLVARDIDARWRPAELLRERARIASLSGRVTVLRRFTPTPAGPKRASPVSIHVDRAALVLETMPAFSVSRGLYALGGQVEVSKRGLPTGAVSVASLLRRGDRADARFSFARARFDLDVSAREARGGALAGALGLPAGGDFALDLDAHGRRRFGAFRLEALSGEARVAEGNGRWTATGGDAEGRISIAASTLLAPYQTVIGPEIRFRVGGRAVTKSLYDMDLVAGGDKAAFTARGEIDPAQQATGPRGLALALRIDEPARLIKAGTGGPLRARGGLGGGGAHWVFDGQASVDRPAFGGFAFTRVLGPVRLEGGGKQTDLKTTLAGEGGTASGLAVGLLGSRPTATADVAFLADRRTILRRVALLGADLKVDGEGRQGLLGDLAFSGQAAVADLAAARTGARGAVAGSWTARQSGKGPWTFSLDAKGRGFAAGVAQVDHLLGTAPTLKARGSIDKDVVNLEQAALSGAGGGATAAGRIGPAGALKVALTWRAAGLFPIGPIEIDGAARGSGDVGGTLAAPSADLIADLAALDLPSLSLRGAHLVARLQKGPNGLDGRFSLAAASAYGAARARAAFALAGNGLEVTGLDADVGGVKAEGSFALRNGAPSNADLTVAAGPGALLASGHASARVRITGGGGEARAVVALTATDAELRGGPFFRTLKITANGPLRRLPYHADGSGIVSGNPWRLTGSGVFSQAAGAGDNIVSFDGQGRARGVDFRTTAPARISFGGDRYGAVLPLGVGGGRAAVTLTGAGSDLTARATLTDLALTTFDPDYAGAISGEADLKGYGHALGGSLTGRIAGVGLKGQKGAATLDGDIKAVLAGTKLQVVTDLSSAKGSSAKIAVTLPVTASAAPFEVALASARPMSGSFAIDAELAPLWDLAMGDDQSLAGRLIASGTLGGTPADPRVIGSATLSGGRFSDSSTGLKLQNVSLQAALRDNAVDVSAFDGRDAGKGSVTGSGRIGLDRAGVSNLQLVLKGFRLIDNDLGQATASGRIDVNRAADGKVKLAGGLTIDHAQIAPNAPAPSAAVAMDVVEIHRKIDPDAMPAAKAPARAAPVELNVGLIAPGGIIIRGRGLNVELSLDAKVTGSTAAPVLTGAARVVRGAYDFAGQRFTLGESGVVHLASTPAGIRLDLTATRDNPTLTAVIRITGTAEKPLITLTSTPVLPQDEVLAQVLFGSSVSSLNGFQAAQLASALSGLASGGGFDVIGGIRNLAHLDRLAINSSVTTTSLSGKTTTTGQSLAGGKYLTDKVYLELSGGAREGPGAQVEWRIKKHVAIVSRVTSQGDQAISIRWRKDY